MCTYRKSLSSLEAASFGLTEKERLAKEEEERNVALIEIQLRDEHSFPALRVSYLTGGLYPECHRFDPPKCVLALFRQTFTISHHDLREGTTTSKEILLMV